MARIDWKKEFDKLDEVNILLQKEKEKEQLRKILIKLAMETEDDGRLLRMATFATSCCKKRLHQGVDGFSEV